MSEGTRYSAAPFIAFDGPDEKGVRAEVKVIVGYGSVDSIEPSKAGKASKVSFEVDNTKYKVSGWAPVDSEVMKNIEKAQADGVPIHFRVENRRKEHVDRSTPIAEVAPPRDMAAANDNIHKSLAAVRLDESDDWVISPHAVTRIDEDPSRGGLHSAYNHSLDELRGSGSSSSSAPSNNSGGRLESAPFFTKNSNGEINPGSYAVAVPINTYGFVSDWCKTHEDVTLTERQRMAVVKAIIKTANRLQVEIYDGALETPDLSLNSHTRARALVFETTKYFFPITNEIVESTENLQSWAEKVFEKSLKMWKWSISEVEALI